MHTRIVIEDGKATLELRPEDEWEQKLIGAIAKGGESLSAAIKYEPDGHYTYGKCKAVRIELAATMEA